VIVSDLLRLGERGVEFVLSLSLVETCVVVLGLLLVLRGLVLGRRLLHGGPGPVETVDLVDGGGSKETVRHVTALLRERLTDTNLFPPSVPTASTSEALDAAVKATPVPQVSAVAALLSSAPAIVRALWGHRVAGVVTADGGGTRITVEISSRREGRVERIETVRGSNADEAAAEASRVIYEEVMSHPEVARHLKPWARWLDEQGRGLKAFQRGLRKERAGSLRGAREAYDEAAEYEPQNALVRLAAGNVLELMAGQPDGGTPRFVALLDAAGHYEAVLSLWDEYWPARYRLAAVYSAVSWWQSGWEELRHQSLRAEQRARFQQLVAALPDPGSVPASALLKKAAELWKRLDRDSATFRGAAPRSLRGVMTTARLCTEVQLLRVDGLSAREEQARLAAEDAPWQATYNLAAFYSLALGVSAAEQHDRLGELALGALDDVVRRQDTAIEMGWLRIDPDFEPLRDWLRVAEVKKGSARFWRSAFSAA
jgi:hypothetical protein